jgi:hypothetical protein
MTWKEKNLITMLRTTRLSLLILHSVLLADAAPATDEIKPRRLRAHDVFHEGDAVLFQDDFQSGRLDRWNFSENDQYNLPQPTPGRIDVVDAPGLAHGRKAVRMEVRRAPDSFRSEISLPYEKGFQERWYAQKLLIPEDWVFDPAKGDDIVMQWHGIPGRHAPPSSSTPLCSAANGLLGSFTPNGLPRRTAFCRSGRTAGSSWIVPGRMSMAPSASTTPPT